VVLVIADERDGKFFPARRTKAACGGLGDIGPVRRQSDSFVAFPTVLSQISRNSISIVLGGAVVNW
jgi:hypothetical protein